MHHHIMVVLTYIYIYTIGGGKWTKQPGKMLRTYYVYDLYINIYIYVDIFLVYIFYVLLYIYTY